MNKKCSHEGGKYIYFAEMINKWCLEFFGSDKYIFNAGIVKKLEKSGGRIHLKCKIVF